MPAGPDQRQRPLLWGLVLLVLLYGGSHLGWYWSTPLGQAAVLDERENLQLAHQIATGTLPAEPFYRAMGYPLFLAGLAALHLLPDGAPQAATAAGLLLHLLNTLLALRLALAWFGSVRAGLFAGVLYGLNPVFIHEATQVLDGTLAGTLCLAGLQCLPGRTDDAPAPGRAVLLSLAWSGAALVRPQLLLLWLAAPAVWLAAAGTGRGWRRQAGTLALALTIGAVPWLLQGAWQWRTSGEFRLLPWQGPYNLWVANHPGANGRYYAQTRVVAPAVPGAHVNPARLESELLYREATGDRGPLRLDAFNRYWSSRLRAEIAARPFAWLGLEFRKACYLLNDFEQYNNKTYAFHRARSPWLRYNPLGWGVLLLLAALGATALARTDRPRFAAVALTAAALAAGLLLAFASGRFRLPLAGLLAVVGGGAVAAPRAWWPERRGGQIALVSLLLGLGVTTYGNWFGAADRATFVQDHLLLASAAERTGADRITWDEARAARALVPAHPDARRLALTAYFNLLLTGHSPPEAEAEWCALARELAASPGAPGAVPHANVVALALWRSGDPAGVRLWRARWSTDADVEALAALALAGQASADELARLRDAPLPTQPGAFQGAALARLFPDRLAAWARDHRDDAWLAEIRAAAGRLFSTRP